MLKFKSAWAEWFFTLFFYLLFFATPLIFEFKTRELFEFPKMIFVYFLAAFLTYGYLLFHGGGLPKTVSLLKPFLLLLGAQSLAALFSTHLYTSVWGYYSRFNGGLFSLISFFLIFLVLSQLINASRKSVVLTALLSGGLIVSLYALLQNFGLEKNFWVQDSQARAFSSLGQPNWLAAYLLMVLPLSFYFYLESKSTLGKVSYFILSLLFYFGFWATLSLSGFLGFLCLGLLMVIFSRSYLTSKRARLGVLLASFVLVSLLRPGIFGAKVDSFIKTLRPKISFQIESQIQAAANKPKELTAPSPTPKSQPTNQKSIDTGDIRLAVWQGALNLWKSNPKNFLIGAGPETFAYNFLPFRPLSLNQTTEWDFLYNKAHNYFLDILTGSGLLGFLAFLFFSFSVVKNWLRHRPRENSGSETLRTPLNDFIFYGWASTFVTNFFGWPTVPLSLLFFTFPILMAPEREAEKPDLGSPSEIKLPLIKTLLSSTPFLLVLWLVANIMLADISFVQGHDHVQMRDLRAAEASFKEAVSLNFWEPAYHKELSFILSQRAILEDGNLTLARESSQEANLAYALNPKNSLTLRSLVRVYYLLARLDSKYETVLESLAERIVALSPTDPQGRYEAALIYEYLENKEMTLKLVGRALDLKPNYPDAQELLQKLEKPTKN